jgi:putative phosphoesterase
VTGGALVGVISDTHGLVRPEVLRALEGVDHILHAGDVGGAGVLDVLRELAPVTAVRGNVDRGAWASELPETEVLEVAGACVYVLHDRGRLDLDPVAAGFHAVVCGHSHRPSVESEGGVLYLNPGSAGPRRFRLPIALARLSIDGPRLEAEIVELQT